MVLTTLDEVVRLSNSLRAERRRKISMLGTSSGSVMSNFRSGDGRTTECLLCVRYSASLRSGSRRAFIAMGGVSCCAIQVSCRNITAMASGLIDATSESLHRLLEAVSGSDFGSDFGCGFVSGARSGNLFAGTGDGSRLAGRGRLLWLVDRVEDDLRRLS